jgi:hypothetical protein
LVDGDVTALDDLESEKDIETRFEAERAALDDAVRKIGHAQIPHAIAIKTEIDAALAKLAKKGEERDAEDCKRFGLALEYGLTTRLVQSVRVQFGRRTHDLRRFAKLNPGEAIGPFARNMFSDFVDTSAW